MNLKTTAAAAIAALVMAGGASAATLQTTDLTYNQGGNDCSGFFGQGFESCQIFIVVDEDGEERRVELSPVIGKYNLDPDQNTGDHWEINSDFGSFTGEEISIFDAASNDIIEEDDSSSNGSWTYAPVGDDPGIRYWVAKGGSGSQFRLHWMVDETEGVAGGACYDLTDSYTLDCLSAALVVNEGEWSTASGNDLSHITFYDTQGPTVIPLPAAGWLLLAGIGGLAAFRRRKSV